MAEEPAIAETDAILENAQNKHEVSSIFRKTKLIGRYGMFKSPIKNVLNILNSLQSKLFDFFELLKDNFWFWYAFYDKKMHLQQLFGYILSNEMSKLNIYFSVRLSF